MCSVNQEYWHLLGAFANAKNSSPFQDQLDLETTDSFLHLIPAHVNVWEAPGREWWQTLWITFSFLLVLIVELYLNLTLKVETAII